MRRAVAIPQPVSTSSRTRAQGRTRPSRRRTTIDANRLPHVPIFRAADAVHCGDQATSGHGWLAKHRSSDPPIGSGVNGRAFPCPVALLVGTLHKEFRRPTRSQGRLPQTTIQRATIDANRLPPVLKSTLGRQTPHRAVLSAPLTSRQRIPCRSTGPLRNRRGWTTLRCPLNASRQLFPRNQSQHHCRPAAATLRWCSGSAPLKSCYPMPRRSNRPPCRPAKLPLTPFGNSSSPDHVILDTLNAASRDVARPVPENPRCGRGMAKSQAPHRHNSA